jgi:hypothetical protein
MDLGSTQRLTKMNTKNLPGGFKGDRRLRLTTAPPPVSRFSRKSGTLDVSQVYGPSPILNITYSTPLLSLSNHGVISDSPSTASAMSELPKNSQNINSTDVSCNVSWNVGKPSTFYATYFRKTKSHSALNLTDSLRRHSCARIHLNITPWSWALLEKPPTAQLLKNFWTFFGTLWFVTVLTRVYLK